MPAMRLMAQCDLVSLPLGPMLLFWLAGEMCLLPVEMAHTVIRTS
jgi:hypothetical protein